MGNIKYAFCHGWMLDPDGFGEVTCTVRERCAYFDVNFYRHHGHHLDEFDELFPMKPCRWFVEKAATMMQHSGQEGIDLSVFGFG